MPTLLTRLRSLGLSKTTPTPAVKPIETGVAPHDERDAQATPDASPDSPNHTAELNSKIYPDLSALFASVEDALRTVGRVTETKKREHLPDETDSENDHGDEQHARIPTNEGSMYTSYGSGFGTGWSSFGQEDTPCPTAPRKAHIASNHQDRTISANFRPSSADAVLSWSPKQSFDSQESLRPSNISNPSLALYPSPEIQQQSAQQSPYHSASPGTFGYPSPPQFPLTDSPSFPPPAFHSTPKTSSSRSRTGRRRSLRTGRRRIPASGPPPPLPEKASTMKRTESDHTRSTRRYASAFGIGAFGERQAPIRASTASSVSRAVNRRKSAEWNTHAASVGVVADPKQTTEFGWPAEVSRELIRLSLGEEAMLHVQDAPSTTPHTTSLRVQPEKTVARDGSPADLKRGLPRVSHDHKVSGKLISSSNSIPQRRPSSAQLYYTSLPRSPSTSFAQGRSDRPQTTITQPASVPDVPSSLAQEATGSQSQSSGNIALDSKPDIKMGEVYALEDRRSQSDHKVDWESPQLQEFISRKESGGDLPGAGPATPMKKSESESTYQTAGSSSYLHAPSLSVIAPTPRNSPGGSRHSSRVSPDAANGLRVPTPPPQTAKSKGKRKAEESEDGSPPDARLTQGKKSILAVEDDGPRRNSSASHAPSSFQSTKSRKRVRLSSPMATPAGSRPGSTVPQHLGSVSSRGSSRSNIHSHFQQQSDSKMVPPRPASRAMSAAVSGRSSAAFHHRRSLSQSSIPLSAIVTPHPPSVDRLSSFHMRDPRKPTLSREVGWALRFSSPDDRGSPFASWAFWFGFLFPLLWWLASIWRVPKTRMVGTDTEKAVIVDDPFYEREARVWRLRCRIASGVFFLTYVPVIVLLAVLVPRS